MIYSFIKNFKLKGFYPLMRYGIYTIIFMFLTGCSLQSGRYQQKHDSRPSRIPTQSELKNAIPKYERHNKANSLPYTVRGKHYRVLKSAKGYSQTGIASWYGEKFHGHLTANGEIYNMYSMSAAHKSLPLPTYLEVTNLANQKTIIVRVNDRGPFHDDRVIDLSYSAAYQLDMLKTGTAKVKITAITDIDAFQQKTLKQSKKAKEQKSYGKTINNIKPSSDSTNKHLANTVIQVFTTSNKILAEKSAEALAILHHRKSQTVKSGEQYRVYLGPFDTQKEMNDTLERLKSNGYPNAYKRLITSA